MSDRSVAILFGSVRHDRAGLPAAKFIAAAVAERGYTPVLIDPLDHPLPMLDRKWKQYPEGEAPPAMQHIHEVIDAADAIIVVSAEYNHAPPPALKNMLDHYDVEFHFKPSGLVTYSAGPFGGVRAAMQLRAIMAELGAISTSATLPIPAVGKNFDAEGRTENAIIHKGAAKFLDDVLWWADAARKQREAAGKPY
jgi:NAD(P)H-dependent FMN reductase